MKLLYLFLINLFSISAFAQSDWGAPEHQKAGEMNGNRVKTMFTNTGILGVPFNGPRMAWIHSNNGYAGDISGVASFRVKMSEQTDFSHSIIKTLLSQFPDSTYPTAIISDVNFRPSTGKEQKPDGSSRSWMPRPGYSNPNQSSPAISNNPNTWPDHWDTFPGEGPADMETYFVMDDQQDDEFNLPPFNHTPDPNNLDRKGFGLRQDVRFIQQSQLAIQDVMFATHEFINESAFSYQDFVFSLIVGGYVGVTGTSPSGNEYDDDFGFFEEKSGTYFTWDGKGDMRNKDWKGSTRGILGIRMVENHRFINSWGFSPSNNIELGNDVWLYDNARKTGGNYTLDVPQDGDSYISSDATDFNPGDTLRYVIIYAFSNSVGDLKRKLDYAEEYWEKRKSGTIPYFKFLQFNQPFLVNKSDVKFSVSSDGINTGNSNFLGFLSVQNNLLSLSVNSDSAFISDSEVSINLEEFLPDQEHELVARCADTTAFVFPYYDLLQFNAVASEYQINGGMNDSMETWVIIDTTIFDKTADYELVVKRNFTGKGKRIPEQSFRYKNLKTSFQSDPVDGFFYEKKLSFPSRNGIGLQVRNIIPADSTGEISTDTDSLTFKNELFEATKKAVGDSLLDFRIEPGIDTSVTGTIAKVTFSKEIITNFTVKDFYGRKIPFIMYDEDRINEQVSGELVHGIQLILLYEGDSLITKQPSDVLAEGVLGTKLRLANNVLVVPKFKESNPVFNEKIRNASVTHRRTFRGERKWVLPGYQILSAKDNAIPNILNIGHAYPNPFNPEVSIPLTVSSATLIQFDIYNVLGQRVQSFERKLQPGAGSVSWKPDSFVPSGVYFIRISGDTKPTTLKVVFLK